LTHLDNAKRLNKIKNALKLIEQVRS
jgi:hypothetical protein